MNNYKVYLHYNKINNKKYFGITKQPLSRRFRNNGEGYKHSIRFYNAIKKYGQDNFGHILLKENLNEKQAIEQEKYLISYYDTTNPLKGYNITPGGDIVNNSNLISEYNKQNQKKGIYNNIKNEVYCIELNRKFESALEAERQTKIDNSGIQKACKNKIKYAGFSPQGQPLHQLYTDDITEEKIKELKFKEEIIKGVNIPVYCIELNELFNSTSEVYNKYKIDPSSIRKVIRGKMHSAGKHPITNEPLHQVERKDLLQTNGKLTQEIQDDLYVK